MRVAQQRQLARRLAVDQPVRTSRVEPQRPVAHHLQAQAADGRSLGPGRAVVDRRQRQEAAGPGRRPRSRGPQDAGASRRNQTAELCSSKARPAACHVAYAAIRPDRRSHAGRHRRRFCVVAPYNWG